MADPQQDAIQVQLPPEVQRGVYANQLIASHSREEFVLDFVFSTAPSAVVNARVVVSPFHAKQFMRALAENIRHYEANFGVIDEAKERGSAPPQTPLM